MYTKPAHEPKWVEETMNKLGISTVSEMQKMESQRNTGIAVYSFLGGSALLAMVLDCISDSTPYLKPTIKAGCFVLTGLCSIIWTKDVVLKIPSTREDLLRKYQPNFSDQYDCPAL